MRMHTLHALMLFCLLIVLHGIYNHDTACKVIGIILAYKFYDSAQSIRI
jgi:hypothetical protein